MKKIFIMAILGVILCFAGCANTPQDQMAWQNFWNNYSQQQQNLTYQQNMQLRDNASQINSQLRNDNYWQEQRAQQEYWDSYRQKVSK